MQIQALTKYPPASLRELLYLALPLVLSFFSASFMGFCDRLFLAHYSLEALEGSVYAGYLCLLFQQPIIRLTSMSQIFVGLYRGKGNDHLIGNSLWQMIWLSLFSMLITLPMSHILTPHFFRGTSVYEPATTYFITVMSLNFLYPLGATLSSFFIGQGRMKVTFLATLAAHTLNICLDYLLIFGVKGIIPPMGIFGAAIATLISQTAFCGIQFYLFLGKGERIRFNTDKYQIHWPDLWSQLKVAGPRAISRIIILATWVYTSRIMTLKGGDYLMVLSIGGTMILLFTFVNDGMHQALITIASNLLGSKMYSKIWKLTRSAAILLFSTTALLSIPYLIFPEYTISFFIKKELSPEQMTILKRACMWLWLHFFSYGFNTIGASLVTASRDLLFYLFTIIFGWLTSFLPTYFGMNSWGWSPDKLWLIMAFDSFLFGVVLLMRASKEKWKEVPTLSTPTS